MGSVSSDDDMPLAKSNGHLSNAKISAAEDRALDKDDSKSRSVAPGLSIRNGPVDEGPVDVDAATNGTKRKSRGSIGKAVNYKDDSDSDDAPMAKRQKQIKKADSDSDDEPISKKKGKLPPSIHDTSLLDESDDDEPLGTKLAQRKAEIEKAASKEAKALQAKAKKATPKKAIKDESDDEPLAKPKKRMSNGGAASASKKANGVKKEESESDSDAPIAKKAKKATPVAKAKAKAAPAKKVSAKKESSATPKKGKSEEPGEEDEEEVNRWWEEENQDNSIKWTTLEHNGVIFPDPYKPLPKHVKLYYDGKPVNLHVEAEEVAWFFGSMLSSTHNVENPVFQKNFFADFKDILKKTGGAKDQDGNKVDIKEFAKLDFKPIYEYAFAMSEAKKARPPAEKKAEKEERDKLVAKYQYCLWDGRKEKVGNFTVEPPGLFRGRGDHPKTGKVKKRVMPEQITINIGKGAKVPEPPPGHKWKAVQHDNTTAWLAMWQENINGNYKYVGLNATATTKQKADFNKFEKARELKKHIDRIRKDYQRDLKSDVMADRQRATAMYLIDRFALRAGNEKDTDNEAETVGCCSLKYEHITLPEPEVVIFDFLGKDSIRFYNKVNVDRQVWKNLKMFKKAPKQAGDDIFDRLTTTQLNKHLSSYMPGLTAKVFRTYNASWTMAKLLRDIPESVKNKSPAEKLVIYNNANREVAVLCNHKRTVGASHEASMEKLGDRIKGAKYQKWRLKMMMLDLEPKLKKKKGAEFFELDKDLDENWVQEHQAFLVEEERKKITKKFEKENEKLVAEKKKPQPEKELKDRLKVASELEAKFKKENKTKKVEAEGKTPSIDKLEKAIEKMDDKIKTMMAQADDKNNNKEVALGTSKINYIDPRLSVVFCKKFNLALEKVFPKTLRDKFSWAIAQVGDDTTWEF